MSHQLGKQEAFQDWVRQSIMRHETALLNLQDWIFALAVQNKISAADLAKAITNGAQLAGFGQNLQVKLKEETDKRVKAERAKLEKQRKAVEELAIKKEPS